MIVAAGRALPGTGVWRSPLVQGQCATCTTKVEAQEQRQLQAISRRRELVRILGGPRPYREFTFSRFAVTDSNRRAFEAAARFDPRRHNLCLCGPAGVGKTHLAMAALRKTYDHVKGAMVTTVASLWRQIRSQHPSQEQRIVDSLAKVGILLLDDLGGASPCLPVTQLLQELIDTRVYGDRFGLLVTSRHPLARLAAVDGQAPLAWRLTRTCTVVEMTPSGDSPRSSPC